jgi:hypothetical protein
VDLPERPDLLTEETVSDIIGVFEVEHVFPPVFVKEEEDVRLGWWDRIKAFFGFRKHAPSAVRD